MKFTHNKIKKTGIAALAAATALAAVPAFGTFADEGSASNKKGTITIDYVYGSSEGTNVRIPGASFDLYRVGDVDLTTGDVTFSSAFEDAGLNLEASDDVIAETLANYAVATDSIVPVQSGETGPNAKCTFAGVDEGAYVLVGHAYGYDGFVYDCEPSYFTVPTDRKLISRETVDDEVTEFVPYYEFTIRPKSERIQDEEQNEYTDIEAIKIWKDDSNSANLRPQSVTVELWKTDKQTRQTTLHDTVELNESVQWRKVWTNLDAKDYEYYCVEKNIPSEYKVNVESGSQSGKYVYSITNTYKPPTITTETTNPPGTYTKRTTNKTLPYTGMLWWPVPFLAAGGLALVLVGVAGKRRRSAADRDSED